LDIEGNLEAMSLLTLVQFIIQEGTQALIQLEQGNNVGSLYLDNNQVCHAELKGSNLNSEEVVYELLNWQKGRFKVSRGVKPPIVTIHKNWDFLLMESLRRIDEITLLNHPVSTEEQTLEEIIANLSETDAATFQEIVAQQKEPLYMSNLEKTLEGFMQIDGAIAAAVVDWESGMTLGTSGSGMDINLAAAGNTNVVRAKMAVMKDLKIKGNIEDILITLSGHYHLIRLLDKHPNIFIYVALNRDNANLGLARHRIGVLEKALII